MNSTLTRRNFLGASIVAVTTASIASFILRSDKPVIRGVAVLTTYEEVREALKLGYPIPSDDVPALLNPRESVVSVDFIKRYDIVKGKWGVSS